MDVYVGPTGTIATMGETTTMTNSYRRSLPRAVWYRTSEMMGARWLRSVAVCLVAALCGSVVFAVPARAQSGDDPMTCDGLVATIVGTEGDDVLVGTWQDDVIVGLGGNDEISGQSGNDTICGGDGDDTLHGNSNLDRIFGGAGDDTITGADGDDVLRGGPGDDSINGDSGADTIHGGNGDDIINGGAGADVLDGGNDYDVVDGSWQVDVCDDAEEAPNCESVTYDGEADPPTQDPPAEPVLCDGLTATIVGTDGDDVLVGTWQDDVIVALGGDDDIVGGSGDDTICAGDGNDTVNGESGDDRIFGGEGHDTIAGASGADVIEGGPGEDVLSGESQADTISGGPGDDIINGGADSDMLDGGEGVDEIDGSWQDDVCSTGETYMSCETIDDPGDPGVDSDGDGVTDDIDDDDDNDGTPDVDDAFPLDPAEDTDTDDDGVGDNADPDDDNDGVADIDDAFPLDLAEDTDTDDDGVGDNADDDDDNDGVLDVDDAFPFDPDESADADEDGIGDNADDDDDNDGTPDVDDAFPNDPEESADSDGDGVGDNADAFPNDPTETVDTDGDGVGDNADAFPEDPTESADTDGDGVGDNADAFPNDPTEDTDTDGDGIGNNADDDDDGDGILDEDDAYPLDADESGDADGDGIGDNADPDDDNDGVPDVDDAFPLDPTESADTDGDGVGDNTDAFPQDPYEYVDSDGDGVGDGSDSFPDDPFESIDSDGDGVGDNADADDDNDGVADGEDAFPFDPDESADFDGGGEGDNADPDDDNDGIDDVDDLFPFDPSEWADTDGDGVGDNADPDIDGDGVPNGDDALPLDATSSSDLDFDGIADEVDDDLDGDGTPNSLDPWPADPTYESDVDGDEIPDVIDFDLDNDGVDDAFDALPFDGDETLDSDFDGVGDNADDDDDNDGVLDVDDAFPFDPTETLDADGNGIGDNADATADQDRDGIPDVEDSDRDGDGRPNESDPFPDDGSEVRDADGDGIGDRSDPDDDNDGISDFLDRTPASGPASPDSDGDGVIDAFDLDPNTASEQRYFVSVDALNSSAQIVSQGFIGADDVHITTTPASTDPSIGAVAGGDIVDFTLRGSTRTFESARISLPYDPTSISDPKVLWQDESTGLWVSDGTDIVADPASGRVEATVDHFSRFVAVDGAVRPVLIPANTTDTCSGDSVGVDVFLLIDDSGSNEFDYIIDGAPESAADPTGFKRETAARTVLEALRLESDRVAVAGFTDTFQYLDFDEIEQSVEAVLEEIEDLVANSRGNGSNLDAALIRVAQGLPADSDRHQVVVVLSDGRASSPFDNPGGFDPDVVHAVSLHPSGDDAMEQLAVAYGGAFIDLSEINAAGLDTLRARIAELSLSGGDDSDGDLISDCEELVGRPAIEAIEWTTTGGVVNAHRGRYWIQTDPLLVDTDGDLAWDSEELYPIDLTALPYADEYADIIAAGFPTVYRLNGDPRDSELPISVAEGAVGSIDPFWSQTDPDVEALANKLPDLAAAIDDDLGPWPSADPTNVEEERRYREARRDLAYRVALETYANLRIDGTHDPQGDPVLLQLQERFNPEADVRGWPRLAGLDPDLNEFAARIDTLLTYSPENVDNPYAFLTRDEVDLILEITSIDEQIRSQELATVGDDPAGKLQIGGLKQQRAALLGRLVSRNIDPDFSIDEWHEAINEDRAALLYLREEVLVQGSGVPVRVDFLGAYRVVKLLRIDPLAPLDSGVEMIDWWTLQLQHTLAQDAQNPSLTVDRRLQLQAELQAANVAALESFRNDVANGGAEFFLDEAQRLAFDLIAFHVNAAPTRIEAPVQSSACLEVSATLTIQLPCKMVVPWPALTFDEFGDVADAEIAALEAAGRSDVVAEVASIWDDIAVSHESAGLWQDSFQAGDYGPVDLSAEQYLEEEIYRFDYNHAGVEIGLTRHAPQVPLNELWVGYDDWPGLVTSQDVSAVRLGTVLHRLIDERLQNDIIDNGVEGIFGDADGVSVADIEKFLPMLPAALQDVVREAIDAGLFVGERFTWADLRKLAELLAGVAGLSVIVASGPIAAFLLAVAGGAGLTVVAIRLTEGEWGWAAAEGAFLLLDVFEFGTVINTVRLIRATDGVTTTLARLSATGDIQGQRLAEELEALIDSVIVAADGAVAAPIPGLLATGRDELREVAVRLANQAPSVTASPEVRRAYFEAVTRNIMVERATLGIVGEAADQAHTANEIVDAVFAAGRVDLNETEFLEAQAFFRTADGEVDVAALRAWEIGGDEAIALGDDAIAAVEDFCFASFSPASLVVMANGDLVPMGQVGVGDQVMSWQDGSAVGATVTATIPHDDVLVDAHLSDGSVLRVTEDHRFLSARSGEWIEIADLAADEPVVTVSGEQVTVTSLDWDSAVYEPAFDLTVAESHNYVVVPDGSTLQLVAHNETKLCGLPVGISYFSLLTKLNATDQQRLANALETMRDAATDSLVGTRSVREVADWAASNPNAALRMLDTNPDWLVGAASNGTTSLRQLLNASVDSPWLAALGDDATRALAVRSDLASFVSRLGALSEVGVTPQVMSDLVARFDAASALRIVDHALEARSISPEAARRVAENSILDPGITRYALAADDAVAAQVATSESIAYELLLHRRLAGALNDTSGLRNVIDTLRQSLIDEPLRLTRLSTPNELDALDDLASLTKDAEEAGAGGARGPHGLRDHGAQTSLLEQFRRVARGTPPGGGRPSLTGTASRANSHVEMAELVEQALQIRPAGSATNVVFTSRSGRPLGEGITGYGTGYEIYTSFVVRFDSDGWFTAFPARSDWIAGRGGAAPFEFRLSVD